MSTIATTLKNDVPDVPCDWIVYDEMCQQDFARCVKNCTVINDVALALFGGHFTQLTSAYGMLFFLIMKLIVIFLC